MRTIRHIDIPLFQQPMAIWDDYGYVGVGVTQARYVLAENGSDYLIN